ncbi:MAG: ATP-dependent DNA helicase [Candidatus Altiarchaeota archaeon]|nr:ATP-dependent DNA helicase [Candidatus Altiarchaeota archaeon]MBU4341561.1 ATP-dependent DNA helicase [Candidatus Altiarchaeota archaeon]MBU4436903.1 ATP-dependent DNA helicase [Candidatus Altiarchaeota archaeon]
MSLFPFKDVRDGQREFMQDVESSLREGKHLMAHAPTGLGKTAAVISPALEFSLKNNKTVFFLTPKHTQHTIVIDTLKRIHKKFKTSFVAVDIIGKQWTCPHKVRDLDSREFNEFCRAIKREERCKYYNSVRRGKLSEKAKQMIAKVKMEPMHAEKVAELCSDKGLCPYEIATEIGKDANVIVCDYFHIFSPQVRKAFLSKLNKELDNMILVIDEAHNLPSRVRKLLSNNLTEFSLNRAVGEANFLGFKTLADDFRDIAGILRELGKGMAKFDERKVKKDEFADALIGKVGMKYNEFVESVNDLGEEVLNIPNRHRSYSKAIGGFLDSWDKEDRGYARILKKGKDTVLSRTCLDPSLSSMTVFDDSYSSVFMSGTLIPVGMYMDVMGLKPERTELREYMSPFPEENRLLLLVPGVTTKFSERSDYMYRRYARIISEIAAEVPGNLAVFFPSYQVMDSVGGNMKGIKKSILAERREMKKDDRIQLCNRLVNLSANGGGILLGVQAGSLSEGVDYANNLLDAVIVVGLPLETPTLEIKSLIEYYDFKFERGWDYGYIYPAMNRALQAAGRCIRSETDRGAIVLMDERFKWQNYRKCFPKDFEFVTTEIPTKYLRRFFQ